MIVCGDAECSVCSEVWDGCVSGEADGMVEVDCVQYQEAAPVCAIQVYRELGATREIVRMASWHRWM